MSAHRACHDVLVLVLRTRRLLLRGWSEDDVDFAFDMYSRPEVQRFIGRFPKVMSQRSEAQLAIARWRAMDDGMHGVWVVHHRQDDRPLGAVILKPIPASSDQDPPPASGDTEIRWHFHPEAWGHGYATEAAARLLQYAFAAGLKKVVAVTNVANTASQSVAERIGMTRAGRTTRYYNMPLQLFTAGRPAG